jgi:hypothetical protein
LWLRNHNQRLGSPNKPLRGHNPELKKLIQIMSPSAHCSSAPALSLAYVLLFTMLNACLCFGLLPLFATFTQSAINFSVLCFYIFLFLAPLGALHTFIASSTQQVPATRRARGGGGDTAAPPGIPVRGLFRGIPNASNVAPAAAHARMIVPPMAKLRSPSAFAVPGGPGRRGFISNPQPVVSGRRWAS